MMINMMFTYTPRQFKIVLTTASFRPVKYLQLGISYAVCSSNVHVVGEHVHDAISLCSHHANSICNGHVHIDHVIYLHGQT